MTPEQIKSNLTAVINTLNIIEVKGRNNMDCLLGCIMTLEKLTQDIDEFEKPEIIGTMITEVKPDGEACETT